MGHEEVISADHPTIIILGLKLFMVALIAFHVASLGELGKQEANFKGRIAYNYLGVLTFLTTAIYISLSWSNLASYEYTNTYIIPQLLTLSCIRMEGVIFIYNVFAAFVVALVLLSIQLSFGVGTFIEYYSLVMFTFVWILIEFRKEKWARIEYLLDLILETQGRATKEEISKSADVLQSILPKRIITKLLMDKKNNIFEEFELITVLQLDIAG